MNKFLLFALTFILSFNSYAQNVIEEPSYCSPEKFAQLEINNPVSESEQNNLQRLHAFKLGKTILVGMAVGNSQTSSTQNFAFQMSDANVAQSNYCTWYFAKSNKTAVDSFISHPIRSPLFITKKNAPKVFMKAVQSSFFEDGNFSFINCAEEHHYIAMGCNEQKHRGPTAFGMLLSFSGCSPDHAAIIVNNTWGLNGFNPKSRLGAIQAAYDYGSKNPEERARLARILTE